MLDFIAAGCRARHRGSPRFIECRLNELDEMIVVESRRRLGYDATAPDTHQNWRDHRRRHGLLEEGVLVYTVDSRIDNGQLPVTVAGSAGDSRTDGFPVLTPSCSVSEFDAEIGVAN